MEALTTRGDLGQPDSKEKKCSRRFCSPLASDSASLSAPYKSCWDTLGEQSVVNFSRVPSLPQGTSVERRFEIENPCLFRTPHTSYGVLFFHPNSSPATTVRSTLH